MKQKKDYNNFKINQIYFLTNDNKVGKELNEKIYQASLEYEVKFDKVEILEELKGKKLNDNDLLVVFMNKYDKNFMKKLYKLIKKYNCLTLISYSYNNNVYIDNLYKYSWKNPCHFCNIGNIEAKLRVNSSGEMSYQSMIDMLYEEDSSFSVESIFGSIESVNIICSILNRLDNLIFRSQGYTYLNHEKLNEVNNSILIDLSTKKISEDISIHWELCDCYE